MIRIQHETQHHFCPKCGGIKIYDAQGMMFVDPAHIDWCTCWRQQPIHNLRAGLIAAVLALAWCIGFGTWLATSLMAMR